MADVLQRMSRRHHRHETPPPPRAPEAFADVYSSVRHKRSVFPPSRNVPLVARTRAVNVHCGGGEVLANTVDAMRDMQDIYGWTDADVIAVHNKFNTASVHPGRLLTRVRETMPIPLACAWAGSADMKFGSCRCRQCLARPAGHGRSFAPGSATPLAPLVVVEVSLAAATTTSAPGASGGELP